MIGFVVTMLVLVNFGGFASLQPGVYSAGTGVVKLRDFKYRALA